MDVKRLIQVNFSIALCLLFTACSSSDNETVTTPPPPVNISPVVDAGADQIIAEKSPVTISSTASDSDGSVASYLWTQISGESVSLTGDDTSEISFTAPIAKQETFLSFEVTVTDNDGATASNSVDITITPVNEINFTVQGSVSNSNGSSSDFVVVYGSITSSTLADVDGTYTLMIEADEDQASDLLFLTNTNIGETSQVYTNVPIAIGELAELAGSDTILDATEYTGTNLTPLSTAFYGLLLQANNLAEPISGDMVTALLETVDPFEAISIATAIQLMSSNPPQQTDPGLGLPAGIASTFEFAKTRSSIFEYQSYAQLNESATFFTERDGLMASLDLIENLSTATYPLTLHSINPYNSLAIINRRFEFNADNSGFFTDSNNSDFPFEWSLDSQLGYVINFPASNGMSSDLGTTFKVVNGVFTEVNWSQLITEINVNPFLDLALGELYTYTTVGQYIFPDNPEIPSEDFSFTGQIHQIQSSDLKAFTSANLIGTNSSTSISLSYSHKELSRRTVGTVSTAFGDRDQISQNSGDIVTLMSDGSASFENLSDTYTNGTWVVTADGKLKLDFTSALTNPASGVEFLVSKITDHTVLNVITRNGETLGAGTGNFANNKAAEQFTSDSVVGVYKQTRKLSDPYQDYFWIELNANGTSTLNNSFDSDQDGILEDNEASALPGVWSLSADGVVTIKRYRNALTGSSNCEPATNINCILSNERTMKFSEQDADRIYVKTSYDFYTPNPDRTAGVLTQDSESIRYYDRATSAPIDIANLPIQNGL